MYRLLLREYLYGQTDTRESPAIVIRVDRAPANTGRSRVVAVPAETAERRAMVRRAMPGKAPHYVQQPGRRG